MMEPLARLASWHYKVILPTALGQEMMAPSREGRLREGERFASVTQLEAAEPGLKPRSTLTHCSTQPCDLKATQTPLVTSPILQMVSLLALSPVCLLHCPQHHLGWGVLFPLDR